MDQSYAAVGRCVDAEALWIAATQRKPDLRQYRGEVSLYAHPQPTTTVEEKAAVRNIPESQILKTVAFGNGKDTYLALAPGRCMVDVRPALQSLGKSRSQARDYSLAKAQPLPSMSEGNMTALIAADDVPCLAGILVDEDTTVYGDTVDVALGDIPYEGHDKVALGKSFSLDLQFAKLAAILKEREEKVHPTCPVTSVVGLVAKK